VIKFPVGDNAMLCVIEPGNIERMKEGRPLRIVLQNGSVVIIAYTPDGAEFERRVAPLMPAGIETVDALLEACLKLPEVLR
jgi:hypothetical protein